MEHSAVSRPIGKQILPVDGVARACPERNTGLPRLIAVDERAPRLACRASSVVCDGDSNQSVCVWYSSPCPYLTSCSGSRRCRSVSGPWNARARSSMHRITSSRGGLVDREVRVVAFCCLPASSTISDLENWPSLQIFICWLVYPSAALALQLLGAGRLRHVRNGLKMGCFLRSNEIRYVDDQRVLREQVNCVWMVWACVIRELPFFEWLLVTRS